MAADQPDYYAVLGVERDATTETIRAQYRRLIKLEHPDRFAGQRARALAANDLDRVQRIDERIALAEQRSRLINQAYLVLSHPKRRQQYDSGHAQRPPRPQGPPKIVLSASRIDLGAISASVTRPFELTIANLGGMPSQISIDWENALLWAGELTIITDPHETFPIVVRTQAITAEMPYSFYSGRLLVRVDGQTYPVEVIFSIRAAPVSHGGPVPITGAPPSAVSGAAPQISFSRLRVDFGFVRVGQQLTSQVLINNMGGMPRQFSIDWQLRPPWAKLTITPDPRYTFPVRVDIEIDTDYLAYGKYPLTLLISLDGQEYRLPVTFEIRDPSVVVTPPPAIRRVTPIKINNRGALVPLMIILVVVFGQVVSGLFNTAFQTYTPNPATALNRFDINQTQVLSEPSSTAASSSVPFQTAAAVPTIGPSPTPTLTAQPNQVTIPSGWKRFPDDELKNTSWEESPVFITGNDAKLSEVNGVFQWTVASWYTDTWWMLANKPGDLGDFFASVRAQQISGATGSTSCGLILWHSQAKQYIVFAVGINGDYTIERQNGAQTSHIADGSTLPPGPGGYTIVALARGNTLSFYVDGRMVYLDTGESLPRGKVGLYAALSQPSTVTNVSFDNLEIDTP